MSLGKEYFNSLFFVVLFFAFKFLRQDLTM